MLTNKIIYKKNISYAPGSILLLLAFVSHCSAASITNPFLVDDDTAFRVNQNLSAIGTLDWEIYAYGFDPQNRKNAVDRIAFGRNGTASLSSNLKINTIFDYNDGISPVSETGYNPIDLRMLSSNFSQDDYFTLDITSGSASAHVVTVWGNRRVCNLRITASLANTGEEISELIGGGTTTEEAWFYQVIFTPDQEGDIFHVKVQPLAVGGTASERLGINAVAVEGSAPVQHLFADVIFDDDMVLQRDMNTPIWGKADAGTEVTVKLDGFPVGSTIADEQGEWFTTTGSHPHDGGLSHTIEISAPDQVPITFDNVVFGDVYLATGQSNQERPVHDGVPTAEVADFPLIRELTIGRNEQKVPVDDPIIERGWRTVHSGTINFFSGTAYFFAKNVHLGTDGQVPPVQERVPVGILSAAYGARDIQHFVPPQGLISAPESAGLRQSLEDNPDPDFSNIYNGMIAPLVPYGIRGALWYQGEADVGESNRIRYQLKKQSLVAGLRKLWNQDDLPFYFVQLPLYDGEGYRELREVQLACSRLPHTGMAVTIETGSPLDRHPKNKRDVGYRLAQWALRDIHSLDVVPSGPLFRSATVEGSSIRITFDYVGQGLMVGLKVREAVVGDPGVEDVTGQQELQFFEIAGADKNYVTAQAVIDGDTIVVSSPAVPNPVHVRYCLYNNPIGSYYLYNKDGLPASPFRTEMGYGLVVENGSPDGCYKPGTAISITAYMPPSGSVFDRWIGIAEGFESPNMQLTMPSQSVYLYAAYRPNAEPAYNLTVSQGVGSGSSKAGSHLIIAAFPPVPGKIFEQWIGETANIENVHASITTTTMPAAHTSVEATYIMPTGDLNNDNQVNIDDLIQMSALWLIAYDINDLAVKSKNWMAQLVP